MKDMAKSSKRPYWRMALDAFLLHETQAKSFSDSMKGMNEVQIEKMVTADGYWGDG